MRGFVYFAGHGKDVKIGKSKNPAQRMGNLNGGNPKDIKLYAVVESADMGELERKMHAHFKECRNKREWFNLTHELHFVIVSLQMHVNPTELDLGIILGEYRAYQHPVADNPTLHRHTQSLELSQQELWALSYAVRSLGMNNYPAFQDRYNEAKRMVMPLLGDEAPMFIRYKGGPVQMEVIKIDAPAAMPAEYDTDGA